MPEKSHPIKISEANFQKLTDIKGDPQTYNDVITRLLAIWEWARRSADLIEGSEAYLRWQRQRKEAEPATVSPESKP
jgi:hypothetical protein